jgi:stage II sporulation protein D
MPPIVCAADSTIRVLLLDGKNMKTPKKNEHLERLGNGKSAVLLGGIKYSGVIEVWKGESGLYVVNELPLEDYIKGVVAAEVGNSWDLEALKAQSVVARTYALSHKIGNGSGKMSYHLTSSVLHQVYKGNPVPENIAKAVDETAGEILTYEGKPIVAFYHSCSSNMTEDPAEVFGKSYPYLRPVETKSDLSPYSMWERKFSISELQQAANIGAFDNISIASHTVSGRVRDFLFSFGDNSTLVSAFILRKNLGWDKLPSTMITDLSRDGDYYVFDGGGYGHGVGMSQWGALQMAREGSNYREILSRFYHGTTIQLHENR